MNAPFDAAAAVAAGTARPIPGCYGYLATNDGRIWSPHAKRIVAGGLQDRGYHTVYICDGNGRRRKALSHRLVALAWVPNPSGLPQVNHLNGKRDDNRPSNLEWCTPGDNMRHAWRTGLQPLTDRMREVARAKALKLNQRKRKLSDSQVADLHRLRAGGMSQRSVAAKLGVSTMVVSNIERGISYAR